MSDPSPTPTAKPAASPDKDHTAWLALAALGVVFGDIGTSPLYALRECFTGQGGIAINRDNILGIVSVMIWALFLIVGIKYVLIVMRADNRGEGGILALITLASGAIGRKSKKRAGGLMVLALIGAALLYSDGMVTPAISVLSAIEGLSTGTPFFEPYIIVIALVVLISLFLMQSRGTAKIGKIFGPVILCWFLTLGILGIVAITKHPSIFLALNPWYAVKFLIHEGLHSFAVFGSVFLAVTGAEMLFADMGHFGRKALRVAWYYVVFPCLLLNYLGQGAYLLSLPPTAENLFFQIVPKWLLYPMVLLSTAAAIIASQATIAGSFSLSRQAVQLGFLPRLQILHTSKRSIGQVYVPLVNWLLMMGTIALVLFFRSSGNLASVYGVALSSDMVITTLLILVIARYKWHVPMPFLIIGGLFFLFLDLAFFSSNVMKIPTGGWAVIIIACVIIVFMKTWIDGREILRQNLFAQALDLETFMKTMQARPVQRVPGIAVFLSGNSKGTPRALLHNLKHNKVLHEKTVILSIRTEDVPFISPAKRTTVRELGEGLYVITAAYGFSEMPDIPRFLKTLRIPELSFDPMQTTFFLGREVLMVKRSHIMAQWRKRIFWFMSHNSLNATSFFNLPVNRVVELGSQVEL